MKEGLREVEVGGGGLKVGGGGGRWKFGGGGMGPGGPGGGGGRVGTGGAAGGVISCEDGGMCGLTRLRGTGEEGMTHVCE